MAIFGKSKKKKEATTTPPQQSHPVYYSQPAVQRPYGNASQSSAALVDRRPNTSHGYGPSQSWAAPPVPYQPIYVTQNYILPPQPHRPSKSTGAISKLKLGSMSNLLTSDVPPCVPGAHIINDGRSTWQKQGTQYLNQGAALIDCISSKLDAVITQIDGERFSGDVKELVVYEQRAPMWEQERNARSEYSQGKSRGIVNSSISSALISTNYFAKVHLYANSRLPPDLPPMKLYVNPSFSLFQL